MKFFTLEWWCGLQGLENIRSHPGFQKHLSSIRGRLPEGLLALQELFPPRCQPSLTRLLALSKFANASIRWRRWQWRLAAIQNAVHWDRLV